MFSVLRTLNRQTWNILNMFPRSLNQKHGYLWSCQVARRTISTNLDFIESTKKGNALLSQQEMDEFMAVFPSIVTDLTTDEGCKEIPVVSSHISKIMNYMVPNGKKNRAMIQIASYKMLEKEQNHTPENIKLANILAWIIELYGSHLVLIDDIVDQSTTRRGAPAWHTLDNRNFESINDGLYLEQGTYYLLTKHFYNRSCFLPLLQLFHDVAIKTTQGEALDCMSNPNKQPNWKLFTMNNFCAIAKYKTAYYTFHLPIFAAMYLANINDTTIQKQVDNVLVQLGEFYQVQNDFWDCYMDPHLTGRDGNDIHEGKCTWFAVSALEKADVKQRKILIENYGKPNTEAEKAVRKVFEELDLRKCYEKYEEESLNKIHNSIRKISKQFPHALLFKVVEKIYKKL